MLVLASDLFSSELITVLTKIPNSSVRTKSTCFMLMDLELDGGNCYISGIVFCELSYETE
jgi:hypothetical protein